MAGKGMVNSAGLTDESGELNSNMERMVLVLKRSPSQEAALETLMEQQTNTKSAYFHQWLTPEESGKTYGSSDSDVVPLNGTGK